MRRVVFVLAGMALGACGVHTALVAGDPPGSHAPPCVASWSSCRLASRVTLATDGADFALVYTPDIAWDGRESLVVYYSRVGVPSGTIAAVGRDGRVSWRTPIDGVQAPRIAWNPHAGTGLVVADAGMQWLGSNGRPVGPFTPFMHASSNFLGDSAPTRDGFLALTGENLWGATVSADYRYALLAPDPEPIAWSLLSARGPRYASEQATGDDGLATAIASSVLGATPSDPDLVEIYPLGADGTPGVPIAIDEGVGPTGPVRGLAEVEGRYVVLIATSTGFSIAEVGATGLVAITPLGIAPPWDSGHLERLNDTIVVAFVESNQVVVAPYDPAAPGGLGARIPIGSGGYSHSPRLARTGRGLALVWAEHPSDLDPAFLSVVAGTLDCCPP